jgi:hypothetical protein
MSEWIVRVVEIGEVVKHPNADSLSITEVEGYPCIIRTGDFQTGDKAVYIPDHVREGIVVKPVRERQSRSIGRVFLKLAGQGYLLRKSA